jgi:hypothetical protein
MKVQRIRLPDRMSWLVLDDHYVPVQPILSYLKFLHDLDRSPNTIRAAAHHTWSREGRHILAVTHGGPAGLSGQAGVVYNA